VDISRLVRRALPSSVTIIALGDSGRSIAEGSGFVASPDGHVVTGWHVLCQAVAVEVEFPNGLRERATFLGGDSIADVAVLAVPPTGAPTLPMTSELPTVGTRVVAIGTPLGYRNSVSEGIVSAIRLQHGTTQVQFTGAVLYGSSGGPVLDNRGRVFAIVRSGVLFAPGLNFATSIAPAFELMKSSRLEGVTPSEQSGHVAWASPAALPLTRCSEN
jgi:putative serine protease PepD